MSYAIELLDELKRAMCDDDFAVAQQKADEVLRKAFHAGADSVKAEADIINETLEQISGRREDEASNAMAQVMLLQFSRMTGKQTVSVTVDTDTIVDDLASTRLTKIAPSDHEITYTLDVLP